MHKVTVQASSDVALIKYWGKKDEALRLPENGSISLVLQGLDTITTVEFSDTYAGDDISIDGKTDQGEVQRVHEHLNRIRQTCGSSLYARVVSTNTFPKGTGLSSSGSGFAALTIAAVKALGCEMSQKELSILARQGSGTACRCVCGGIVEWQDAVTSEESYAQTLYPAEYWDIRDVIAIVDDGKKKTSSSEGHTRAQTSILFQPRQQHIQHKINLLKECLAKKDFEAFGSLIESEALEFHSILLTSTPPLIAWYPGTIAVMQEVHHLRSQGIPAYFTINTGFNVHILTLPEYEREVSARIQSSPFVKNCLFAQVGNGPVRIDKHLF